MNVGSFSLIFIVLLVIIVSFNYKYIEKFKSEPVLHVPQSPVQQRNLVEGTTEDYAPSYVLASGPSPGSIASFNSLPYRDPSAQSANYQRILNIQTTLKGFLENEALGIQELSDPSIQLPLMSARSDLQRLRNQVLVLKRNPGIDSSITQGDLDEVEANLAYLQNKWRMSVYNENEGFQDGSGAYVVDYDNTEYESSAPVYDSSGAVYDSSGAVYDSSDAIYDSSGADTTYSSVISSAVRAVTDAITGGRTDGSGANVPIDSSGSNPSSLNIKISDLRDLINKIDVSIARLSSSGTTDPVVLTRVSVLQKIKRKVEDILNEVISGARAEADIPISKDSYTNFLKVISNTNSPLPQLFGSNVALADLFPAYSAGDASGAMFAQYLFKQYADLLFKGISWDVGMNIRYSSPAEQQLANTIASSFGNNQNINTQAYNYNTLLSNTQQQQQQQPYAGANFSNTINNLQNQYLPNQQYNQQYNQQSNMYNNYNQNSNNKTTTKQHFDWHKRANDICESVQKHGMNPSDFGCLRPEQYVSENFSWRGYAKMICSRLATSYDTGLPETCGCPPTSWAGWKS